MRSSGSRRCCRRACASSSIACPRCSWPSRARARVAGRVSPDIVARLLEATLHFRVTTMRYHSVSSARMKDYLVHPYRLAFAQGGMYLLAYVPEYKAVRTFAVDRIASASLEKQTFTPTQAVGDDVFANSLGVNTGPAERVEIEFDARVAPYVRARVWHPSQELEDVTDGRVSVKLNVCHDWASAKLDPQLGPVRACGLAATTGEGDSRRSRGSRYEIPMKSPLRLVLLALGLLVFLGGTVAAPLLHRLAVVRRSGLPAGLSHDDPEPGDAVQPLLRRRPRSGWSRI